MADIKVRDLHKEFGVGEDKVVALENVNLEITGHVFVSIVGASGCGKSTLLNILSGIETPDQRPGQRSPRTAGRPRPATSSRRPGCCPWRTVMDNLLFVQKDRSEADPRPLPALPGHGAAGRQGQEVPRRAVRRHAAACRHRPGLLDRAGRALHGRAVQPPRRDHRPVAARRAAEHVAGDQEDRRLRDPRRRRGRRAVQPDPRLRQGRPDGRRPRVPLPFPRDVADADVALAKANVFKTFEDIGALAVS